MRYLLLFSFIACCLSAYSQLPGDITGDDIVDANDYLFLKENLSTDAPYQFIEDFDKDGYRTVRDLVLLHNYLYANGVGLDALNINQNNDIARASFGQFNAKKNNLKLVVSSNSKPLRAFQFEVSNMKKIELQKKYPSIVVVNNKIIGLPLKNGQYDSEIILSIKLSAGISAEYCIENALFVDELGNNFGRELGDCANPLWSAEGLEQIKVDVKNNSFNGATDMDRNGEVDMKDYALLFDYLYAKGPPPPGEHSETKKRVRVEMARSKKEGDYFELLIAGSDAIYAFDLSFYGISKVVNITNLDAKLSNFEYDETRLLWFGSKDESYREIRLLVQFEKPVDSKKACMRAPVFIDDEGHYFGVKLGKCLDLNFDEEGEHVLAEQFSKWKDKLTTHKEKNPKTPKEKKQKKEKKVVEAKSKTKDKEKQPKQNNKEVTDLKEKITDLENELNELKNKIDQNEKSSIDENEDNGKEDSNKTVKILSLTNAQISKLKPKKGQLVYNSEEAIFMLYNGTKWEATKVAPGVTVK